MKREFLQSLNLEKEVIDQIMGEHGKSVEAQKQAVTTSTAEKDAIKALLDEANKQIETFKTLDVEGIKKSAEEYKTKFEQAQTESNEKLATMQFNYALDKALTGAKAKDPKLVEVLLDRSTLKLDETGAIKGLDAQLETIKKERDYLFAAEGTPPATPPGPVITAPRNGGDGGAQETDPFILGLKGNVK